MRVVAGELGGRKLVTPAGLGTRPTTDKVRQAVFNSLDAAGLLDGAVCVDLFAGSGALGIEAISRGAANCTFVERDRAALDALRTNLAALGIADRASVVVADALSWVRGAPPVDIALIDPPYTFDRWSELLDPLDAGVVVAESDRELSLPGWHVRRAKRYGRTWVSTLERAAAEDERQVTGSDGPN